LLAIKPSDSEGLAYGKRLTLKSPYKAFPSWVFSIEVRTVPISGVLASNQP